MADQPMSALRLAAAPTGPVLPEQSGPRQAETYYPAFDWLRFGLACAVMLAHEGTLASWPNAGNFAVQIFFALSGWLIGGILLKTRGQDLPRFYFNRAVRIWGPYFVALGLLVLASAVHDHITAKWWEFVFYKASFVYNFFGPPQLANYRWAMPLQGTGNHFWSLGVEEQFYLMAPLLLVLLPAAFGHSLRVWLVLALVACWSNQYAAIALGVVAALIHQKQPSLLRSVPGRLGLVLVFLGCAVALLWDTNYGRFAPWAAVMFMLMVALPGRRSPLGSFLGGMSYPLYLNHWIGLSVASSVFAHLGWSGGVAQTLTALLIAFIVATVLYRLVDCPLLAHRAQLYSAARGRLAMTVAYGSVATGLLGGWALQRMH